MIDFKFSEKDLQHIFAGSAHRESSLKKTLKYFAIFLMVFVIVFVSINFSAIKKSLDYWYRSDFKADNGYSKYYPNAVISIQPAENYSKVQNTLPTIAENRLFIPKIDTDAPISWQVNNNEKEVQSGLQNGVVHLVGTALPGQNGNVFITGHSSNYIWSKGSYKNVFALLNKIVVGDLIYLKYRNITYVYRAEEIRIVTPSDVSVLQSSGKSILTLMTCTPVGTSINRLIIQSTQIIPDPAKNTAFSNNPASTPPQGVR